MAFKNQILDVLGDSKRATLMHREDGRDYFESRQDAEPLIEWVKQRAQQTDDIDYKFVGVIPEATINQAMLEGWFHDKASWERWMQDNPKFTAKYHR